MSSLYRNCGSPLGGEPETTAGCPVGQVEDAVSSPEEKSPDTQSDDSPEAWRVECEKATFHAGVLLRLAKIPGGTAAAIAEMIQTAPRSESDLDSLPETGLFARIARAAYRYGGDTDSFSAATEYISEHLMKMTPERRRLLEASVTGVFVGWLMS
jgi:hypothetical protein